MNKNGFVWYELMTRGDLDAAVAFYKAVVGWEVKDSGMPGMKYMIFGKDGRDVGGMMSWQSMGMDKPTTWKGHIYTSDLDTELTAVVKDGGTVFKPTQEIPGIGRFAVVGDPTGAEYLLFEPATQNEEPKRLAQNEVGSVGWHELSTHGWEKAWEFYSSHYGWEKDFAMDMKEMGIYQTFRIDTDKYIGAMMNIAPFMQVAEPAWLFYFQVADVDAAIPAITAGGGKVMHGPMDVPGGSRIVQAVDPQGGYFALVSAKA